MYKGWQIARWETPVVDRDRVLMVSLIDTGGELVLVFEDTESSERLRWRVRFRKYPAYRNIDERYRVALWCWLDESGQRCGFTFTVTEPVPFASWDTDYLHDMVPATRHFVIATNDDVIEVLSGEEPVWEGIAAAAPDDPVPVKSIHLYVGEDDDAIHRLSADLKDRNRPQ